MIRLMNNAAKEADIAKLEALNAQDPNWGLAEEPLQFIPKYLDQIGQRAPRQTLGMGFIKLLYPDFIVEEITPDGQIASINLRQTLPHPELPEGGKAIPKLEATMVKQAYGTFEAIEAVAEALKLPKTAVTYSGLKDGRALTSQLISFNSTDQAAIEALKLPNIIIKDVHSRIGVRNIGELLGNRFTILVRTDKPVDAKALETALGPIKSQGFWNFYSLQRFGNRLLTHRIGQMVLTGRHEDALRLFLCGSSPHETRTFQHLRTQAAEQWGNWAAMTKVYNEYPFFMEKELRATAALEQTGGNISAGLAAISDQIKFAVAAFGSYHFNALLSKKIASGDAPAELPLLNPETISLFASELGADQLAGISFSQPGLPFLGENRTKTAPTRSKIVVHSATVIPEGVIFHFDLPKAAYATTFMAELFDLYQGRPVPDWVNQAEVDTRAPLGYPPVTETTSQFMAGEVPGLAEE